MLAKIIGFFILLDGFLSLSWFEKKIVKLKEVIKSKLSGKKKMMEVLKIVNQSKSWEDLGRILRMFMGLLLLTLS